jgi:hypothetical protein
MPMLAVSSSLVRSLPWAEGWMEYDVRTRS